MDIPVSDIQKVFPHVVNASKGSWLQSLDWIEDASAEGNGQVEVLVTDRILHGREEMVEFVERAERAPATIEDLLRHSYLAEDQLVAVIGSTPSIEDEPRLVRARGSTLRFAQPNEPLFPGQGVLVRRFS